MYYESLKSLVYHYIVILICFFVIICKVKCNDDYDYGFVAYLFSKANTSIKCTGAIVASHWILNDCQYGEYKYDAVKVGVSLKKYRRNSAERDYDLCQRVDHPGHTIKYFPQIDPKYDLRYLYASSHAIFLDRTKEEIEMTMKLVRPIAISQSSTLPREGKTVFFPKGERTAVAHHKVLPVVNTTFCNDYFKKYNLSLQPIHQYCVDSSDVTFEECCASHGIMEKGNLLIGVVAWSTGCFKRPEPWVFTNLGLYYQWITNITSDEPILWSKMWSKKRISRKYKSTFLTECQD